MANEIIGANIRAQRFFVWLTVALGVLFAVAYMGLVRFFPPPPADLSAHQVQELYTAHNIRLRIGTVLGLIAGGFLVPITIVISVQMARLEKGVPLWALDAITFAGALACGALSWFLLEKRALKLKSLTLPAPPWRMVAEAGGRKAG